MSIRNTYESLENDLDYGNQLNCFWGRKISFGLNFDSYFIIKFI